jgi:hypothetical protein
MPRCSGLVIGLAEIMENPGTFCGRDKPLYRTDWKQVNVPCVKVEYIVDFTSR